MQDRDDTNGETEKARDHHGAPKDSTGESGKQKIHPRVTLLFSPGIRHTKHLFGVDGVERDKEGGGNTSDRSFERKIELARGSHQETQNDNPKASHSLLRGVTSQHDRRKEDVENNRQGTRHIVERNFHPLQAEIVDVETAFLEGDMDTELYMTIPQGLEMFDQVEDDDCLPLLKCIYGSVQAARQWWKKFITTLESFGFKRSPVDPCVLMRQDEDGIIIVCCYVDDALLIGHQAAIDKTKKQIDSIFTTKKSPEVTEYVGVSIREDKQENALFLSQPDVIARMERHFGPEVEKLKVFTTPMPSGMGIQRPTEKDVKLNDIDQSRFRSGVGSLNYVVKHSRPDLANAVRELAKVMDGATAHHMKLMERVIKFVFDTKDQEMKLGPRVRDDGKWTIVGYSDSDYGGDKDTRRSVTGFVVFVNGAPISWRSRAQRSVTLSSTEGEYVAASETAAEMMFIRNNLKFFGIELADKMQLFVDNAGAIHLTKNESVSRTKHVDIRAHYVRELKDILEVIYVPSKENISDLFTKNVTTELFNQHSAHFWGCSEPSQRHG